MITLEDREYRIKKVGNRVEPENRNQEEMFDYRGVVAGDKIEIGRPVVVFFNSREFFQTSRIRSVYRHTDSSDYDKLVLPKDFPVTDALSIPTLEEGDILLATMNSMYMMRKVRIKGE